MDINYRSIVNSLSGSDEGIVKHLPYLLQDLYELGGGSRIITDLLDRNLRISSETKVVELCCGKGALLNTIIQKYKCYGKGIDLFEPFIIEARERSVKAKIQHLLEYEVMDIKDAVDTLYGYDLVIYGNDTDVLGSETESLRKIMPIFKSSGYIIYETASASLEEIYKLMKKVGLEVIDQSWPDKEEIVEINKVNNRKIKHRARELSNLYPDETVLFEDYVKSQEQESIELENKLKLITLLLKKI
jgi:SAM-dependent methyltransferase